MEQLHGKNLVPPLLSKNNNPFRAVIKKILEKIGSEPSMVKIHSVIKFWARKAPSLIEKILPPNTKSLLDPFCGSGTTGYVGILRRVKKILLSDINPVAVFITHTTLNKTVLSDDIYIRIQRICRNVEKEAYTFIYNGVKYIIEKSAWITKYICPHCGDIIDPRSSRKIKSKKLICKSCNEKFYSVRAKQFCDEVFEIHAYDENGQKVIINDPGFLKSYIEECKSLVASAWFPDGKFNYPSGRPFLQHPRLIENIAELFTNRGLFAASKLYQFIEDIWSENPQQGDLLKLTFVSSIVAATKMLPYTRTSGTSWKLPRYWIPHVRFEKNFCRTFLRKLDIIYKFKKSWAKSVRSYSINVSYDSNYVPSLPNYSVYVIKADVRDLIIDEKVNLVVMDPPHFSEINYYELTYLWQLWLKGRYNDKRFTDFDYWKNEIDINPHAGRNLNHYIRELSQIVSKYVKMLSGDGKLLLILHNSNRKILERTIGCIKNHVGSIQNREISVRIPSSAQGIHGKRKQKLYLLIITN